MNLQHSWKEVDDQSRSHLEAELRSELGPDHALWNVAFSILARRVDCDDVALEFQDRSNRIAVVHLTWRGAREASNKWQRTVFFASREDFDRQQIDAL